MSADGGLGGSDKVWLDDSTVGLKLECLSLAVEAAKSREPKTVPVLALAQEYYDWVVKVGYGRENV